MTCTDTYPWYARPHDGPQTSYTDAQQRETGGMSRARVLIGLAFLAVAAALMAYRVSLIPPDYVGGKLTVAEAHQQAVEGNVVLIDIRRPQEWRHTGVPDGAALLDMRRDDFEPALATIVGPDRSRPIALICARGVRSARLALELTDAGYTNIIDVPEGMLGSAAGPGWLDAGLPVNSAPQESE
ncbi:rhodanese-like domain-containing protein [Sedimentitalea todarodis]|uniref:Rhodanese-like domain-containing protein n=1 Tax=Sedimentitalea todarodis TaxID=1631240 RepID=A0ABU3VCZ8_9RHOB|nr:rhodanese-like domain-containing protein [Sedimentitalea todarodis]MDU9003958.1 rhodanese-like domain-containing protein [Sedimentitalea todarodis]